MHVLIADSGSTKTEWALACDGVLVRRFFTKGINPYFQQEEEIRKEVGVNLFPLLQDARLPVDRVCFYGAGCAFPDKLMVIRRAVNAFWKIPVEVGSDLLGAARCLCGNEPGIACILGTGSNSCFYNGHDIGQTVSPLGFILGDEGSGAWLGKQLVGDCLKNQLPPGIKEKFLAQFSLTPELILERVYKQPFPNRFLAGLSPFLAENLDVPGIRSIVSSGFIAFFRRNVMQYAYREYPVHFVGSVAYYYRELLVEAARDSGIRVGQVMKTPVPGLIRYHRSCL